MGGVRPELARFIPACAGNSRSRSASTSRSSVHPRVCGELACRNPLNEGRSGSSPRVRGTRPTSRTTSRCGWFIPACAGNSKNLLTAGVIVAVHPRVCGELARRAPLPASARRFIPACAGNSPRPRCIMVAPAVHPRVCGELRASLLGVVNAAGSSPRVRGTQSGLRERSRPRRFIPACAGNSERRFVGHRRTPVHPRVCGELIPDSITSSSSFGSSPRVRGTRSAPA